MRSFRHSSGLSMSKTDRAAADTNSWLLYNLQLRDVYKRQVHGEHDALYIIRLSLVLELYNILKTEVGRCREWDTLIERLKRQGVEVQFKYKGQTDDIQGIVFLSLIHI